MEKDLVADIKARLSVEEVVGSYLDLKKTGRGYKALSPFKSEKTPSLIVTPAKEIWKDFSSGKGGSLFNFVMEYEGVDFKEALQILARKAGLEPQDYRRAGTKTAAPVQNLRRAAYKVLKLATDFYAKQLQQSTVAKRYLKQRGFARQVMTDFGLGYAPDSWEALYLYLKTAKVPVGYMALAGLVTKRPIPQWLRDKENLTATERWGDFFAERLIIPLSDPQGEVIGFTGRLLVDKSGVAKYINTKQTILYNKSKHVFGYFQAKEAIRQSGFALVVEGNLDVVACHQAGYPQTVAAGGTALTVDHLKIIGRLTDDVRLAFDGDAAGTAAMERSIKSAGLAKVDLSIVSLPSGLDPDDLIKKDLKQWQKIVANKQPAPEWLYDKHKAQVNLKTAQGKKQLTDVILPILNCLRDEVEKDHYLKKLEADGISRTALDEKMQALASQGSTLVKSTPVPTTPAPTPPQASTLPTINPDKDFKIQLLLGLLLIEPQLRSAPPVQAFEERLKVIFASQAPRRQIYEFLLGELDLKIDNPQRLPAPLQSLKDYVSICLDTIKEYTDKGGSYIDDDFSTKLGVFCDLFRQLDGLQTKLDRIKP